MTLSQVNGKFYIFFLIKSLYVYVTVQAATVWHKFFAFAKIKIVTNVNWYRKYQRHRSPVPYKADTPFDIK